MTNNSSFGFARMRTLAATLTLPLALTTAVSAQSAPSCSIDYDLPADIMGTTSNATDSTFQEFGWRTFLGINAPSVGGQISTSGDNVAQWGSWSATVDLLLCQESPTPAGCICPNGDCTASGTHFYPSACREVPNYQNYRVLGQVDKIDDSFLEAQSGGLSGDPVLDRTGNFLRYEILLSPATYDEVISQELYDEDKIKERTSPINLNCGVNTYSGGDPSDADMGAMVLKVAWMDVTDALQSGAVDGSQYHLEQLLVSTPDYRNSDGEATCDLRTMAMVGMHVAHKTFNQPVWIWSTFEHNDNAPDCTGPFPAPNFSTGGPNESCPDSVAGEFNFFGELCNDGAQACADCNAPPAANGDCDNPSSSVGDGFCLDEAPAAVGGISKLCRQVPISSYPEAESWNTACQGALGSDSVWGHYSLISSQWGTSEIPAGCSNVSSDIFSGNVNDTRIKPKVSAGGQMKPLLANTSMESYERSNCMGCHSKARFTNDDGNELSTDFIYFLQLQVSAPAASRPRFVGDLAPRPLPTAEDDSSCNVAKPRPGGAAWLWLLPAALLALGRRRR